MSALWSYLGDQKGSFQARNADHTSRLYFPLMNEAGMRSSITPELKGDISGGFDQYLMPPVVTEDLHRSLNARYVWIKGTDTAPWNINGLSPDQQSKKWTSEAEKSEIIARPGLFTLSRQHPIWPLDTHISVFVPSGQDQVELWKIELRNTGSDPIELNPYMALPLYGRHADNLRDHRQVTTMFQRCYRDEAGVRIKPSIVHDEAGHRLNATSYFAYFYDEHGGQPDQIWSRMQDFIGEGGGLGMPKAIWKSEKEPLLHPDQRHGVEAVSAVDFGKQSLAAGESKFFVAVIGITKKDDHHEIAGRYNNLAKVNAALDKTLEYWDSLTQQVHFETGQPEFDEWAKWLAFQLKCRQIFGNSYLPDFGYGRGGRGWRDLWQDLLSIFLVDPDSAKNEIVNNLKGIRIDGSNATIIGSNPGEFKADRNNIARTWCDHGAWPLFALDFYIQQTGDLDVLFTKISYWKDQFIARSTQLDQKWNASQGTWLKNHQGEEYSGTVLEHVLVQQLSAFYHVGEHNILKLEGADWNDTLDMARNRGESSCFQSFYTGNLALLINWVKQIKSQGKEIELLQEMTPLLDRLMGQIPVNYEKPAEKLSRLKAFFEKVSHEVSGKTVSVDLDGLIHDLESKHYHSVNHIQNQEWIKRSSSEGYFNGHYDDLGRAMHGSYPEGIRMDLTSQVMPVLFNVASEKQTELLYRSAREILGDPHGPGLRLCTPYPEIDMNIGRITGFVYGFKEHGSKWMQQNIMFMHALFHRNKVDQATEMFQEIYSIAQNSSVAKTFPGIPSFYEPGDRGAYMYLTGSSTWIFLSLVTQVFGIRGKEGNLLINPKLSDWFFDPNGKAGIEFSFQNKRMRVDYFSKERKSPSEYRITDVRINNQSYYSGSTRELLIDQEFFKSLERDLLNIEVDLG